MFFIPWVLKHISDPRFFSRAIAVVLRVSAVLVALGGFFSWFHAVQAVGHLNGSGTLGGVIFLLVFAAAVYMVTHVLLIRAGDIAHLPSSEFAIFPVASILLRMLGELYACLLTAMGAGGFVLILFGGNTFLADRVMQITPGTSLISLFVFQFAAGSNGTLTPAILFLFSSLFGALMALVFFYLLAEAMTLFMVTARNIRLLREASQPQQPGQPTGIA
jgi:hypothetical protein